MIQNKKRIISLILMLTLLVSALVVGAITASAEGEGSYVKVTSADDFTSGQYVIVANGYALTKYASKWVEVVKPTISGDEVTDTKGAVWTITVSGNKATLKDSIGQFIKPSGSNTNGITTGEYSWTWSINNQTFQFAGTGVKLALNSGSSYKARAYKDGTISGTPNGYPCNFTLYKFVESTSGDEGGETPACEHTNKVAIGEAKDATCTEAGITAGEKCANTDCNKVITEQEVIPALGHNYVDGACSVCGANEPNYVFKKVTAAPADWSGTYLIVYEDGNVAFNGARTNLDTTSNYIGVTINNDEIAFNEQLNESTFIIAKSDSGYTIMSASGYYIGQTTNANGLKSSTSTTYANTLSINNDGTVNFVSGGAYLRFNSAADQMRFRYYTSSTYSNQKAIVLYKLVEKETVVCTHEEAVYTSNNDGTHNVFCECGYADNNLACSGGETSCVSGKLCEYCKFEYDTERKNHNYLGGSCSVCTKEAPDFSGRYYIASIRSSGNYWYMTNNIDDKSDRYLIVDSNVTDLPSQISEHVLSQIFVLESYGNGKYYIYAEGITGDAKYLGWTSGNSGTLVEKESEDVVLLTVDYLESEVFNIHFAASDAERYLALNGTSGNDYFAFYKSGQKQDLSLIPVSDHVYADATCTAPKTCACGATEGEALGHNHENCPHKAVVGETYYETLQDAIADVAAGSEIVLNSDIEVVGDLTIENQVIINLNGKTLTAGAVVTFYEGTQFIGEGKLVVAKDSLYNIKGETKYVPVWNAPVLGENDEVVTPGYYTFSEVKDQIKESTVEGTEVVVFRPAFKNTEIKKEFADGATDNGISFVINITWGTGENAVSKQYTLTDEFIANVYNAENPKAIQLGFENWQAGVEYTVTLRIVSGGLYYETTLCTMKDGAITVPEIVTE